MSIEAITWALGSQVGDTTRKMVLVGFANHAHRDGRNAWASKETVAEYAECDKRTVRRHVNALVAGGWMREGDQQQVAHIRGDRRPVVYDLAMNEATRVAWKAAREDSLPPRTETTPPAAEDTTGGQAVTPYRVHGVTPASGGTDCPGGHPGSHGVTPVSPKPFRTEEPPLPPASGGSTSCVKHPDAPQPNCRSCGTTPRQLAERDRQQAAEARRLADRAALEAQRAEKARTFAAGRSPEIDQLLTHTRRQLARSPR